MTTRRGMSNPNRRRALIARSPFFRRFAARRRTSRLKVRPRSSKFLNMSQLVQAGARRTTSPRTACAKGQADDLAVVRGPRQRARRRRAPPRSCPAASPTRTTDRARLLTARRRGEKSPPLSAAAEDEDDGAVEAGQGLEGGVDGRRLGVVDEADAANGEDVLQPVLEGRGRPGSSGASRPGRRREGGRRGRRP